MIYGDLIAGAKFIRAESSSACRRTFIKLERPVYAASESKDTFNAVDLTTGQLKHFEFDVEVFGLI